MNPLLTITGWADGVEVVGAGSSFLSLQEIKKDEKMISRWVVITLNFFI
jgi:hypothetical protein